MNTCVKNNISQCVDQKEDVLISMSDSIFDHPETAFQEMYAAGLLEDFLKEHGFQVQRGQGSLETAFRAQYRCGDGGPRIGFLCEYDALPAGYACGHQMQGPAVAGAALAIRECLKDCGYTLIVYGTPVEEGRGGKAVLMEEGFLTDMDVALMMRGGPATQTDIRSNDSAYLDELTGRFENVMKGAALMTGTHSEIVYHRRLEGKIPVLRLNELLMENAVYYNLPNRQQDRKKTGSTDFANVMYRLPGACIRVAFVPPGTSPHSQEYLDAGKTPDAHRAVVCGAKVLAAAGADLILDPELLEEIKEELRQRKSGEIELPG